MEVFLLTEEQLQMVLERLVVLLYFIGFENLANVLDLDVASILFVNKAPHFVPAAVGQSQAVAVRFLLHFHSEAVDLIKEVSGLRLVEVSLQVLVQIDENHGDEFRACLAQGIKVGIGSVLVGTKEDSQEKVHEQEETNNQVDNEEQAE